MKKSRTAALLAGILLLAAANGANAQEGFTIRVNGPSGEFTSGAQFNARVLLDVREDGIQGWSLGVQHDVNALELLSAESGATVLESNDGRGPDFSVLNDDPPGPPEGLDGLTQAVVLSFVNPVFLPVADAQELVVMNYSVIADPTTVDPCEPLTTTIEFSDVLGTPPVQTLLTQNGESVNPEKVGLPVTVRCPGSLEITRCEGTTEDIFIDWIFGGPIRWDFLFLYRDSELLAELAVDQTSYVDEDLAPGDYVYTVITFVVDDPASPTLLFASCTGTIIPVTIDSVEPASGDWLGGTEITVTGRAFTTIENTTLEFFADGEDPLPLEIVEIRNENELGARTPEAPRLGSYSLRLTNERGGAESADVFSYGFIRGEMNSAAPTDISDATYLLGFLFLGDQEEPRCPDSADFTDDGLLDISDPITLLSFLFLGADAPAAPFPDAGEDPTNDALGCLD